MPSGTSPRRRTGALDKAELEVLSSFGSVEGLLLPTADGGGMHSGAITMDDSSITTATLEQVDEEILVSTASDEALEAAAGTERRANDTLLEGSTLYYGCC